MTVPSDVLFAGVLLGVASFGAVIGFNLKAMIDVWRHDCMPHDPGTCQRKSEQKPTGGGITEPWEW